MSDSPRTGDSTLPHSTPHDSRSCDANWTAVDRSHCAAAPDGLLLSEVVSALSHALDLSTGQPVGHSVRSCLLAMRVAREYGLPEFALEELFYACLLKDVGCSSNASLTFHAFQSDDLAVKHDVKTKDWTSTNWETLAYVLSHVGRGKPLWERVRALAKLAVTQKQHAKRVTQMRCERGATLTRLIGLSPEVAQGIYALDEHWDGGGQPDGLTREEIPVYSRFMLLGQTLEVCEKEAGADAALDVIRERSKRWFDPAIVRATQSVAKRGQLWQGLDSAAMYDLVLEQVPAQKLHQQNELSLDAIALAFAQVVDAKSPFTYNHSNGVANAATAIARQLGLSSDRVLTIRHAALLHDLGKLSVSNAILEKPGKLDDAEWQCMRRHPFYTWKILNVIRGLKDLSEIAASHHEKLDGTGYFRGLSAQHLNLESRILAVADIFDALSADRPYRKGMPMEKVYSILRNDSGRALDADSVEALIESGIGSNQTFVDLMTLQQNLADAHTHAAAEPQTLLTR